MKFGEVKCAVMRVEKGKVINSDTPLKINNFKIKSTKKSTNILVRTKTSPTVVQLIKKKVSSEYFKRIRKIWKSEFSAFKQIAHNSLAVPVLTPTSGILD